MKAYEDVAVQALKNTIQQLEEENAKLWHENKKLKKENELLESFLNPKKFEYTQEKEGK